MISTVSYHKTFAVAALLLAMSCCGTWTSRACSQERSSSDSPQSAIESWIRDLQSPAFAARRTASAELRKAGSAAIEPLTKALESAGAEQKSRIQEILRELQQDTFAARLDKLRKTASVSVAEQLPEWNRFSKIVGTDDSSLKLYVRLLNAEPALFTAVMEKSRDLPRLVQARAAALLQAARPSPARTQEFSIDSYAALLLLVSDNTRRASGDTSTSVSTLLGYKPFRTALDQPDGKLLLRLAATYIMRDRIAVEGPLDFARDFPVPEGPILARRVLKTALRGHNAIFAMMLLKDQGTAEDISLLESLFNDKGELFKGRRTQANNLIVDYRAYNGDMALAVAIAMRKQDPRDYGFGKGMTKDGEFDFVAETIGFDSDIERKQARKKYEQQFLNGDAVR